MRKTPLLRIFVSKTGFTLIELLVVVAIIALLTAILLPVFFTVRGKARQTVCVSNLRQIGLAVGMYSEDYDELYPSGNDPSDTDTIPNIWTASPYFAQVQSMPPLQGILQPYIHSPEIWHCPSDSGYTELDVSAYNGAGIPLDMTPTAFGKRGTSYLYRTEIALLGTRYGSLVAYSPGPNGEMHEGSDVNVLMDGNGSWHGGFLVSQKRYNELMGDGHVVNQNIAQFGQTWNLQLKQP